jgi:protein SCO1
VRRLREVYERFRRDRRDAQFLIVTLDPATDTPERLLAFKKEQRLPESWHLLTGPRTQTRELARLLGIHTFDLDSHVMHDGAIVIFDAQGRGRSSFSGWNLDDETPL